MHEIRGHGAAEAAVERRSSIGRISSASARSASSIEPPPFSTISVFGSLTTVGATLPSASLVTGPRTPANTTLEMACAARVPTFRNHCFPVTGGTSTATISSSGRRTLFR